MCVHHMHALDALELELQANGGESPSIGAENSIQVLWKDSKCA